MLEALLISLAADVSQPRQDLLPQEAWIIFRAAVDLQQVADTVAAHHQGEESIRADIAVHLAPSVLVANLIWVSPELTLRNPSLEGHIRNCMASLYHVQAEIVDRQVVLPLALAGKEYPLDFLTVNYPVFSES